MKYNVGVVGTGYMARKHCDALASHDDARLVTICSTERSTHIADEFRNLYGFSKAVTGYASVLGDPSIDIVFLCTPDNTHSDYVVAALHAGKHVFCEKPLARMSTDFKQIRDQLQDANGKVLQVGMNCRFREQYSLPKQIISTGNLGELRLLRGTYIYNAVRFVRNGEKEWSLDYPRDIFPFLHGGGIHCIDLLRWIGGDVYSVFARGAAFELANEYNMDTFSISLEFANGVIGELLISATAFRPNDFNLELWLSEGSILGTTIYRRKGDVVREGHEEIFVEQKIVDLLLQYNDIVRAIETGSVSLNSFEDAYNNFKVAGAIERSVRERRIVYLAEIN